MRHSSGDIIAYLSSTIVGLGIIWRYVVRPARQAWRRVSLELETLHDLAQRELTHNGGASLKDAVHRTDKTVAALDAEVMSLRTQGDETSHAVEALAQVMDAVVDRKQEDHERMWHQIIALGGEDPRRREKENR